MWAAISQEVNDVAKPRSWTYFPMLVKESSITADPCPAASDLKAGKPSINKIALGLLG